MLIPLSRVNIYLLNILIRIKLSILHLKKKKKVYVRGFRLFDVAYFVKEF